MNVKMRFLANVCILMILLCSCGQKITNRKELLTYLHDSQNGLFKEDTKGSITTSASYVPYQLIAKGNYGHTKNNSSNRGASSLYSSKVYFVVSFSKDGQELLNQLNMDVYTDIFQTLSFRMMPLISLKTDKGHKVLPVDCFFQQTYGFSSSNELLLVFDSNQIKDFKDYHLSIDEFGLGLGDLSYRFLKNDIDNLNNRLNM